MWRDGDKRERAKQQNARLLLPLADQQILVALGPRNVEFHLVTGDNSFEGQLPSVDDFRAPKHSATL
jgi:hypothetical protein